MPTKCNEIYGCRRISQPTGVKNAVNLGDKSNCKKAHAFNSKMQTAMQKRKRMRSNWFLIV